MLPLAGEYVTSKDFLEQEQRIALGTYILWYETIRIAQYLRSKMIQYLGNTELQGIVATYRAVVRCPMRMSKQKRAPRIEFCGDNDDQIEGLAGCLVLKRYIVG